MPSILFLFVFFSLSSGWALGEEEGRITIDETLQMGLADHFLEVGDLYRAITEYQRFLFFFPRSVRAEEARWKIAVAYFQGKKWDEAIRAADDFVKRYAASPWTPEALFLQGRASAEKKDYSQARYFFQRAEEAAPGKPLASQAQWQIGVTYVKEERWKEAAAEFRKVSPESRIYPQAEFFARGLDRMDEIPQKSPVAAGILAGVLPGAGHLYSERYRDAAVAFALNGAFIWGMVESFEHKNYVVGGILTFFELGWYSGNVYSAVSSAHKYNRNKKREYLDRLEKEGNFSLGFSVHERYPALSFRYTF